MNIRKQNEDILLKLLFYVGGRVVCRSATPVPYWFRVNRIDIGGIKCMVASLTPQTQMHVCKSNPATPTH